MIEGDLIPYTCHHGKSIRRELTPEMRLAAEQLVKEKPSHIRLAERLEAIWREKKGDDHARFSPREVFSVTIRGDYLNELVALGVLAIVEYPSGAWQYAFTAYTRTWFFTLQASADKGKT